MLTSSSLGGVAGRTEVGCSNVPGLLESALALLGLPKLKAGAVVAGAPNENGADFFSCAGGVDGADPKENGLVALFSETGSDGAEFGR